MRVTYIHQHFALPESGAGTRSYEFARRLVAAGHTVKMITGPSSLPARYQHRRVQRFVIDGIEITVVPGAYNNTMSDQRRLIAFIRFAARAVLEVLKGRADIVYATSTPLTVAIPALTRRMVRGTPYVFEVRDLWPDVPIAMGRLRQPGLSWLARALERVTYRHASAIVALSPPAAKIIASRTAQSTPIHVIPNSSDIERFTVDSETAHKARVQLGVQPLDKLILYAGTFGEVNAVDYLVDVAYELRSQPFHKFLLVGSGAQREQVIRYAEELGLLNSTVFILDRTSKEQAAVLHAASDVCISTVQNVEILEMNSANKIFDALAAGRPVAINHGGWLAHLLTESGAGIVLDPRPKEGAMVLAAFLDDEHGLRNARQRAKELARDQFSRDLHSSTLERILLDAATHGSHRKRS